MRHAHPRLLAAQTDRSATLEFAGGPQKVRLGESWEGLTLRAAWSPNQEAFAAFENDDELLIISNRQPFLRALIARPFGDLASLQQEAIPRFDAEHYEALTAADKDPLALALQRSGEPSFAAVADLLPPVLDMTFLGDERVLERPIVRPDGEIEGHFDAAFPFDTSQEALHYRHGLLAGSMNAICYGFFDEQREAGVELLAFALADDPSGKPAVYRRLRRARGDEEAITHERSCEGAGEVTWRFYAALLAAFERDQEYLSRGAELRVPEAAVQAGVEASMRLADLTFRGVLPRYGVGYYDQECHHSFPPSTIFFIWANLEWGRFERARQVLSHYLSRRVNPDGSFDYYGPAVAEYGQMLTLCARYAQLSKDREWWDNYLVIIRRMVDRLLALREESKRRNRSVKRRGLIPGLPEADYHGDEKQWKKYYFAGDVWVCRGLREVGRALRQSPATEAEGTRLIAESREYEKDIKAAVKASLKSDGRFVPAGPNEPAAFKRMTESRHASYCNYRYLPEMMSAGILDKKTMRMIAAYRRAHGGELLGMTRFQDHLDDWPAWHCARGLLDLDDVDGYLTTFYGHLAHHQSRGNWAAYEQVWIEPRDGAHRSLYNHAEQVVPCQVMAPIMLKHMLVDEDRERDVLHILRACPAAWLASTQGVTVARVPTRWGPVSLSARRARSYIKLRLELGFAGRGPDEVRIRLALPEMQLARVTRDGEEHTDFDARKGRIVLRDLQAGEVRLLVEFE